MIKMNEDKKRRLLVKLEKEELINMIINEQSKLISYRKSTERVIGDLKKDKSKLQNNWNELKYGLKSLFEFEEGVVSKDYLECAEDTLKKMQDLEGNNDSKRDV